MKNVLQMPLRIPKTLHPILKAAAENEGISLNQYCLYLLARYSGGDVDLKRKKGEDLLKFLEEAQYLQKQMKKINLPTGETSQESVKQRWDKLYGKARTHSH